MPQSDDAISDKWKNGLFVCIAFHFNGMWVTLWGYTLNSQIQKHQNLKTIFSDISTLDLFTQLLVVTYALVLNWWCQTRALEITSLIITFTQATIDVVECFFEIKDHIYNII